MKYFWLGIAAMAAQGELLAERINHEGRILGPVPVVTDAVLFNTAQADGILAAMQVCPVSNPWNEDISRRPLLPNSDAMIAQISADLSSTRRTLRAFQEMNFVLVPDTQAPVPISFVDYPDESDPSPYPIPANLPIEAWPSQTGGLTLQQWQEDVNNIGGDRHAIIVQPGAGFIWEMWQAKRVGSAWQASNGARFDLNNNALRPAGWTSADAAGLPMFPALPRYDECQRGVVEHACRIVVARTRREYIYPATHYASTTSAAFTNVPAMGQRLRLKSSFAIPASWTREEKAILQALKKYGAIVADNGGFFSISVTPDDRWPANAFNHLSTIGITNFEVIQTSGPTQGPRSAGAPTAAAGLDFTAPTGVSVGIHGYVGFTGTPPIVAWKTYSGPAQAVFADSSRTNTMVQFTAPGTYVLMLSADDQIHAVAHDAVTVTVSQMVLLSAGRSGTDVVLNWSGNAWSYVVEQAGSSTGEWQSVLVTPAQTARLPMTGTAGFYRVRAQ